MSTSPKPALNNYPFQFGLKTRWRDLDAFRHVNNAVFATYVEDARIDLFKRWGLSPTGGEKSVIAASLKLDYLKQLSHPSQLIIGQRISRLGNTSFDIESAVFLKDEPDDPICQTLLTCVCFDYVAQRTVPVYEDITKDYNIDT